MNKPDLPKPNRKELEEELGIIENMLNEYQLGSLSPFIGCPEMSQTSRSDDMARLKKRKAEIKSCLPYIPYEAMQQHAHTEAKRPVNSDSKPAKWRKAFEYESDGLNALYDLIERNYFDADGNPIYNIAQLPLKKNLDSKWLKGRTKNEADTIITSGKRKGKAE